jgi:hypothetical protein
MRVLAQHKKPASNPSKLKKALRIRCYKPRLPSAPNTRLDGGDTYPLAGVIHTRPAIAPLQKPEMEIFRLRLRTMSIMSQHKPPIDADRFVIMKALTEREFIASSLPAGN